MILVLLGLNVSSYFIIYNSWSDMRAQAESEFFNSSHAIAARIIEYKVEKISPTFKEELIRDHNLANISILPLKGVERNKLNIKNWLKGQAQFLSDKQLQLVTSFLLKRGYYELSQGEDKNYYYITEHKGKDKAFVLVISKSIPALEFLDSISGKVIIFSSAITLFIMGLFILLTRFVMSPYRRIKEKAEEAGRFKEGQSDDVDELVSDYVKIIGELKEKEAELRKYNENIQQRYDQLENFNEYLLTSLSTGVISFDLDLKVTSINDAATEQLNIPRDNFYNQTIEKLFEENQEIIIWLNNVLKEKKHIPYVEFNYIHKNETESILGISIAPVFNSSEEMIGAGMMINDTTEINLLRDKIETSKKMAEMGEMSGGLAHQLRNSLCAITGFSRLIRKRIDDPAKIVSSISSLEAEVNEAELLIKKFLDFTKPFMLNKEKSDLSELIKETIASFVNQDSALEISFKLNLNENISFEFDRLLVKQALRNFIENSIKAYEGAGGVIKIDITENRSEIVLTIEDFASGISQEDQKYIFTPFYSKYSSGTGLGLPLARKIIDLHQGEISVSSELGKGTKISVKFPHNQSRDEHKFEKNLI